MGFANVALEREGGIAVCTLSNPPTHTLTAAGVGELHQVLDELEQDAGLRVLVLTGAGEGVFVAHYEVGELAEGAERSSAAKDPGAPAKRSTETRLHPMHQLCLRLERLPAVTIAAVNGNAAGGGCELALACDFRLMANGDYRFGLPETSVGIIPGAGGTQRFARLLGTARALDVILHAHLMTPEEALGLGLVSRLYPVESFRADVHAFARGMEARAPIALKAAKQAIRAGVELSLEEGLAEEQRCFDRTMRSKDAAGAMRAWLSGETWEWTGE